jgi:phenylalanyl-tRNA synthetase beta chain
VRGEADLVEEVARVASLSKLASAPLERPEEGVAAPALTPMQRRVRRARRALAAQGLDECVTYSFCDARAAALFGGGGAEMALENPISSELSHMRPSALPNLVAAAARNQARGAQEIALFELGPAFHGPEPGAQRAEAAGLRAGFAAPREWTGARRDWDVWDARADAEAALAACGVDVSRLTVAREAPDWLHPGRAGALKLGPQRTLASFGELHPRVAEALDLRGRAVAFQVWLEAAPAAKTRGSARPALRASDLQAVERDFAFVIDAGVEAATALAAARAADRALIAEARVFDLFDGPEAEAALGPGRKSLALTVRLQPTRATLTEAEIEAVASRVVERVEAATGGRLRSTGSH